MKKFIQKALLLSTLFISIKSQSQNQVYWREGFEPDQGTTLPTTNPTSLTPTPTTDVTYFFNGVGGSWWGKNVYRTTGTGCPPGNNHPRFRNMGTNGTFDSGALVTPVVDFGIQEFHFARARASRTYSVWVTNDTSATTSNWTYVARLSGWGNPTCQDTTVIIGSATAKRLKLTTRAGLDVDIDSVWITSFSQILPVKFGAFSASFSEGKTKLNWQIESEINTLKYSIEQSINGKDFITIANLEAKQMKNYSFITNALNGDVHYRIKAVDKDGKFTYSSIIKVNSSSKNQLELTLAPNPVVNGKVSLQVNGVNKGIYTLNIYSLLGNKVYSTNINSDGVSFSKTIDLLNVIPSGNYLLQLTNGINQISKSVLIK